jgi:uncharacterized membrane protein (DUF106 family)
MVSFIRTAPADYITDDLVRIEEFKKLQKEVQELKKQIKLNKKKRWIKNGRKY